MTKWEALAAKESLICFQPFIEGERVLLVTDHAVLTWAKTYENGNRRLVAWGLVFAAYPQLIIVHQPGRTHSNVDPLSRLPHIPQYISPARNDLPSPAALTEHEDLQSAWEAFIKECEHAVESKTITMRCKAKWLTGVLAMPKEPDYVKSSKAKSRDVSDSTANAPMAIHVRVNIETIEHFAKGYVEDKDFALALRRTQEERLQDQKYCAYHLAENGLMYFKDANSNVRLCIPSSDHSSLI